MEMDSHRELDPRPRKEVALSLENLTAQSTRERQRGRRRFSLSLAGLKSTPFKELQQQQQDYHYKQPVDMNFQLLFLSPVGCHVM
ncbi:hypothetical protein PanWU01x14_134020 [Parasponia andersonii]|uniref:Uncharacterized protein n=1 Tax=Parasponia andersonii TaxID=3476 RepID=A0A2P5CQ18_PARAD|nr:hypothetical protein PanWU01x14_134020 [Parasponia andersonii]